MTDKPVLLFVSTRVLFPADSGGKIRTGQILRGMKGGAFHIRLMMPRPAGGTSEFADDVAAVSDEVVYFEPYEREGLFWKLRRALWAFKDKPIPVLSDWSKDAAECVGRELAREPSLVLFDFPHSAVLAPESFDRPSVMFTHNIEAVIFERHWKVAKSPLTRWLWKGQYLKMKAFEKDILNRFDTSIAVSPSDADYFREEYGVANSPSIETGTDLDFYQYREPTRDNDVVFCGSMDWIANIDGVRWFHDNVWPIVLDKVPSATMTVVGRKPPATLESHVAKNSPEWTFTGFVDDVRDHVPGASAFVIPLRVGGGTRIKAFEAMAMGVPVVSTSIGMEGLAVEHGEHFLCADEPVDMAEQIVTLMQNAEERRRISGVARQLVQDRYSSEVVARQFEGICLGTLESWNKARGQSAEQ